MKNFMTLNRLTGEYTNNPESIFITTGPALLVSTLSWAIRNDIPFHKAILSLTEQGRSHSKYEIHIFPSKTNWNLCLELTYQDLVSGNPLYISLRKRMDYFLPEYFLKAVERAEKENRLDVILPHFAKRINFIAGLKVSYSDALIVPVMQLLIVAFITSILCLFIVPKMVRICEELLEGTPYPFGLEFLRSISYYAKDFFVEGFIIAAILYFIYKFTLKIVFCILERVLTYVPFLNRMIKSLAIIEFSAGMASYLAAGEDILKAAIFCHDACHFHWLRGKLKIFISELEKGTPWLDAWDKMGLKHPINNWIIHNSALRDNVIEGFDMILEWTCIKILKNSRNNVRWLEICCTLFNAIIIGTIVMAFFGVLVNIIETSSQFL